MVEALSRAAKCRAQRRPTATLDLLGPLVFSTATTAFDFSHLAHRAPRRAAAPGAVGRANRRPRRQDGAAAAATRAPPASIACGAWRRFAEIGRMGGLPKLLPGWQRHLGRGDRRFRYCATSTRSSVYRLQAARRLRSHRAGSGDRAARWRPARPPVSANLTLWPIPPCPYAAAQWRQATMFAPGRWSARLADIADRLAADAAVAAADELCLELP